MRTRTLKDGNTINLYPGDLEYPFEFIPDIPKFGKSIIKLKLSGALNLSPQQDISNIKTILATTGIVFPFNSKTADLLIGKNDVAFCQGKKRKIVRVRAEIDDTNENQIILSK
jgi:hypothetical protein